MLECLKKRLRLFFYRKGAKKKALARRTAREMMRR